MENKTEHMRRMRLRVRYWRVTPTSEPLFKLGKVNVMSDQEPSDYDADIPAVADAARAMLAALEAIANIDANCNSEPDVMGDALNDINTIATQAIAKAKAAGIKGEE